MSITRIESRDNFTWMLATLVFLLFLSALTEHMIVETNLVLVNIGISIILLVAIWTIDRGRPLRGLRVGVSLLVLFVFVLEELVSGLEMGLANLVLLIAVLMMALASTCRQVLFPTRVDANVIVGAMLLYLLMGLVWAVAYLMLEQFSPGALRGLESGEWQTQLQSIIYYSFVTLSTLGYGDLVPQQPMAQYLAYMEAITGQFYLSVLVAALVSTALTGNGSAGQSVAEDQSRG